MKTIFSILTFLIGLSHEAYACPLCFSAKGASLTAYRLSTLFLTFVPLIVIFSFVSWYRRQLKKKASHS